jgi:hypothetical protein
MKKKPRVWTLAKGMSNKMLNDGEWMAMLKIVLSGKPFKAELIIQEVGCSLSSKTKK